MQRTIKLLSGYTIILAVLGLLATIEGVKVGVSYGGNFWSGPGGYLTIIGCVLLFFALVDSILGDRNKGKGPPVAMHEQQEILPPPSANHWQLIVKRHEMTPVIKMRLTLILCILYILLIQPLGFVIASLVYLALNMWLLNNPTKSIVSTLVVLFCILRYGLPLMGLSIPKGIFGF